MLSLKLVYPGKYLAQIEVLADAKISNIRTVEDNDLQFCYNGYFLNETKSFSFYNLSENDTIIVVPSTAERQINQNNYAKLSNNISKFFSHMKKSQNSSLSSSGSFSKNESSYYNKFYDPSFQREVSRIRDIEFLRMEYKPKFLRKIQMKHNNFIDSQKNNQSNSFSLFSSNNNSQIDNSGEMSTVIGPQSLEPCIDPLPIINFND